MLIDYDGKPDKFVKQAFKYLIKSSEVFCLHFTIVFCIVMILSNVIEQKRVKRKTRSTNKLHVHYLIK